jgi:glycerol uptake facilitator-like aquaporin
VVGLATATHDPSRSVGQFALYGLGMGLVVTALTVATALFKGAMLAGARVVGARLLAGASGALLVLTGAYVVAYWLALGF